MLNLLVVKSLLVLRLRAIWNKDLIGKSARKCTAHYIDSFLVTLILYTMTAGMICRIRFMIDRNDWWSKIVEVLVGFKDSTIPNAQLIAFFRLRCLCWYLTHMPTHLVECYSLSMVAGGMKCIYLIQHTDLAVPMSTCSNMFCVADLHIYCHTKKNCQDDSNRNRSPVDLDQVYLDIQNTKDFRWWDTRPYFTHANLDSVIVCILPRWNVVIHTVSRKLDIINPTDGLSIQSLG